MVREFDNGSENLRSIPGRDMQKTQKMVFNGS